MVMELHLCCFEHIVQSFGGRFSYSISNSLVVVCANIHCHHSTFDIMSSDVLVHSYAIIYHKPSVSSRALHVVKFIAFQKY